MDNRIIKLSLNIILKWGLSQKTAALAALTYAEFAKRATDYELGRALGVIEAYHTIGLIPTEINDEAVTLLGKIDKARTEDEAWKILNAHFTNDHIKED